MRFTSVRRVRAVVQEDVGNGTGGYSVFHYPRLTSIGFQDVQVNDAAPRLDGLEPDAMHPNGNQTGAPSPLHNDAFDIRTTTGFLPPA